MTSFWRPAGVAAVAACAVAGLGALATDLGLWYQSLLKPPWQPPDWLFPPAWTTIFVLSAIAGVIAWRSAPDERSRDLVVALFTVTGLLNVLWSVLFFQLHRPDWALYEVVLLWLSIALLIGVFLRWSIAAGALLVPYLAWVSFAAVLTYAVVQLNAPF